MSNRNIDAHMALMTRMDSDRYDDQGNQITPAEEPGLQPLDFSAYADSDSEELKVYKAKVLKVAENAKRDHGHKWCSDTDYDHILRTLDLKPKKQRVKVAVKTSHPFEFEIEVSPADYEGNTPSNQAGLLALEINKRLATGPFKMSIPAESIVDMRVVQPEPVPEPTTEEEGTPKSERHIWFRVTGSGKYHAYSRYYSVAAYYSIFAVCNAVGAQASAVSAAADLPEPNPHEKCGNCLRTLNARS